MISTLKSLLTLTSLRALILVAVSCTALPLANASEFTVQSIEKDIPAKLGDSIKAELQSQAVQISKAEKPIYQLWLRKEIPLETAPESPEKALKSVGQTTLMGAIAITADERDYRDDELYQGVYTIRFGLRPQDGNHLGTSEHLYFAVLVEAKNDPELGKITKSRQLVKASSKTSATDHPMILSLFPVSSTDAETPSVHEPAPDHEAIRLSIPAKNPDGSAAGPLVFDLVVAGMADF